MVNRQTLMEILELGTRAMSTYNIQPWRFAIRGNEIVLYLLRSKNFFLKLEGISWIELGALVENLTASAASKGCKAEFRFHGERLGLGESCATICLENSAADDPAALALITDRCTHRGDYQRRPLAAPVQSIVYESCDDPNIEVVVLSGVRMELCARMLSDLEGIRYGNYWLIEEARHFIRFDSREIETKRDYLDARTLEMEPLAMAYLKHCSGSRFLHGLLRRIAFAWIQRKNFESRLLKSGALIAFILKNRETVDYIRLGRLIQRIANRLVGEKVFSMPLVSGLYLLDCLKKNFEIFSDKDRIRILRYGFDLETFLNAAGRRAAFFLRAGYAEAPRYRSLRKPLKELIIKEE